MPELPEVERVRLSLVDHLIGRRIVGVTVRRAGVVERHRDHPVKQLPNALLINQTVLAIERHGKQLALIAGAPRQPLDEQPALCIHLGMTGSLIHHAAPPARSTIKHTHLLWQLDTGTALHFDDPRRFGGVWTFPRFADLKHERWSTLGPDAMLITTDDLHRRLRETRRALKAALLDQQLIAGLGNIYVDELLFLTGLHPSLRASRIKEPQVAALVEHMAPLLRRAIDSGGSSLRDYVDGNGQSGSFQSLHQVYGRGGEPCVRCEATLRSAVIGGRTTVFCAGCQRR